MKKAIQRGKFHKLITCSVGCKFRPVKLACLWTCSELEKLFGKNMWITASKIPDCFRTPVLVMLQEFEDQKNQCCMNWILSWHKSGLICLKQWDYWATPAVDVAHIFHAIGEFTLCYIPNCSQCIYWCHVWLLGHSFPAGQAAFWAETPPGLWERRALCTPHHEGGKFNMPSGWHRETTSYCYVFALILFPVYALGVPGKRGWGKNIASLTEIHRDHHNLLEILIRNDWCFYWSSCNLPWAFSFPYDCPYTLYRVEGVPWHFSENNVNGSGLPPLVTLEKSGGRKLTKMFWESMYSSLSIRW